MTKKIKWCVKKIVGDCEHVFSKKFDTKAALEDGYVRSTEIIQVEEELDDRPFYVISQAGNYGDARAFFHIQREPGRGNMGGRPIVKGWLRTTGDVRWVAHGAFGTQEAAEAYIHTHSRD